MVAIEIVSNIRDYEIYWISLIVSKVNKSKIQKILLLLQQYKQKCIFILMHV